MQMARPMATEEVVLGVFALQGEQAAAGYLNAVLLARGDCSVVIART